MKRNMLRACLSLFRIRLVEAMQYRLAAVSGASIGIFWALVEIVIYTVFFRYAEHRAASINGLTLVQTVSYVWIAQMLVPLQPMSVDGEILTQIQNGDVGVELCRPLDLYAHWFAKTAAGRLGTFWLRAAVTVVVAVLLPASLRLTGPASPAGLGLFLLSAVSAFLLCIACSMLMTAVRLGITWGEGPMYLMALVAGLLSGSFLPLQLWPDALQGFLLVQPFAGVVDIPARLYVGSMAPSQGLWAIALQLAWALLIAVAGRLVMRHKLRTLIIQGG